MNSKKKPKKPGPSPETLKAEGADWEDAMRHALNKPKPAEGFPDKGECEHKNLSKERIMGAQTGDKICDDCGKEFTITELRDLGR